jgi:hypothetical protein
MDQQLILGVAFEVMMIVFFLPHPNVDANRIDYGREDVSIY